MNPYGGSDLGGTVHTLLVKQEIIDVDNVDNTKASFPSQRRSPIKIPSEDEISPLNYSNVEFTKNYQFPPGPRYATLPSYPKLETSTPNKTQNSQMGEPAFVEGHKSARRTLKMVEEAPKTPPNTTGSKGKTTWPSGQQYCIIFDRRLLGNNGTEVWHKFLQMTYLNNHSRPTDHVQFSAINIKHRHYFTKPKNYVYLVYFPELTLNSCWLGNTVFMSCHGCLFHISGMKESQRHQH